ncbi:uncharacterized protein LOC143570150 [Bidens hawaiensis]|uniref:uncharacterized protein LOC143570150 n=1 Tax=Bidens hawaiensis TaxID=980011 RepID=UPI00404B70B9
MYSTHSPKSQSIELDLESETDLGLRKLEDAFHSIIVRQSTPDWLPFVPGSSYWVPPLHRRPDCHGIVGLLRKFHNNNNNKSVSVGSASGWPSFAYFIGGTSALHPVPIEMEAEEVHSNEENTHDVNNEEG